ncbi:MAG: sugar phosphate isomerase/epimerase [Defluviitaleaceae bacterium]|nr:sugar phosphate isomerase/epimerase [Defluviitaleaceae bacterium]
MYYGAQLYTVREFTQTEADFERTIEKVAKMGYKWAQLSAAGPIPAKKIREICDRYGVKIPLTHTDANKILHNTQEVIEDHRIMGADYIGLSYLDGEYRRTREGIERFAADYAPAIEEIGRAGLKFMYHNHDFEFQKSEGKLVFDHIIDLLPKSVGFVLDLFWIQAGGGDPAWWIEKLAGRVDTIHFKDMVMYDGERRMCEIFEGNLNWERIYSACEKAGVKWAFVEQDDCYGKDQFECLKLSLDNMEKYKKF